MKIAVVGSGPSGWSAAVKLLELGHDVTVFDGGVSEESPNQSPTNLSINQKLLRGSNYPYRMFRSGPKISQKKTNLSYSFSSSGLSLVWGATMLPYGTKELDSWPIKNTDLDSYYDQVSKVVPISGKNDDLVRCYRPYLSREPLLPTNRVMTFLHQVESVSTGHIFVGSSRLAIEPKKGTKGSCNYCDSCLSGCPRDLIWFAPQIEREEINYLTGLRVLSISESSNVALNVVDSNGQESIYSNFDKVFLGAGNIETFRILSTSRMVESSVKLLDSATFFIPFLLKSKYGKPEKAKYSLSQALMRIEDEAYKPLQIQLYDYSEDLVQRAQERLLFGKKIPKWILRIPLKRLFVGIGYLHSTDSPCIQMRLTDAGDVELTQGCSSQIPTNFKVEKVLKHNKSFFGKAGLMPIYKLIQYALPGEGVHAGGWLPMGTSSDLLGRPSGSKNIHVIDSSIFPSIPAGAITFTVMANAMRIAEQACE